MTREEKIKTIAEIIKKSQLNACARRFYIEITNDPQEMQCEELERINILATSIVDSLGIDKDEFFLILEEMRMKSRIFDYPIGLANALTDNIITIKEK